MVRKIVGLILVKTADIIKKGIRFFTIPYYKSLCLHCGNNVYLGHNLSMTWSSLDIGDHVYIGDRCCFILAKAKLKIGNHVMFAPNVTIRGGDHRLDVIGKYIDEVTEKLPENDLDVVIEDDVWIGCNVTILKGVTVGQGSVIGAGSIVTKSIPPYTIHVGCGSIKEFPRFSEEQIKEHKTLLYQ